MRKGQVKIIWVRVKKCSWPTLWYANKVGQVFPVVPIADKNHLHYPGYEVSSGGAFIKRKDCERVEVQVLENA